jgi:hypothetical protein
MDVSVHDQIHIRMDEYRTQVAVCRRCMRVASVLSILYHLHAPLASAHFGLPVGHAVVAVGTLQSLPISRLVAFLARGEEQARVRHADQAKFGVAQTVAITY